MIHEVLLVHHSHTDIGYTHPQPVIFELHRRFIDEALDLAEEYCDWPEECRFKWTCEVTGITLDWWRHACEADRQRFLNAVRRGQFEVAGLAWNITPLVDHGMLLKLLEPVKTLRALGIPVRAAMNSDVNGLPWGMVDALLDFGIDGLSMAINEHYGYAIQPRPRGFWWESPSGRKLLVWNGLQYWNGANIHMRIPEGIAEVREAMTAYLRVWEERGYPHSFFPMQVTTPTAPDNAAPDSRLPVFVRDWNATEPPVRLRLVTLSEVFDRLFDEPLPSLRGDWTDWWNFGAGSTARETALALEGERLLDASEQLRAWNIPLGREEGGAGCRGRAPSRLVRDEAIRERAYRAISLYVEHTWGADRSVRQPQSLETYTQLNQKLAFAYEGYALARMLRRDGLDRLALHAGGDELTALFYNPLPFPVRRTLQVPVAEGELAYLSEPREHLRHRMDVMLADLPAPTASDSASFWTGPIEIPALGYVALPYRELPRPSGGLRANEEGIGNGRLEVRIDRERGGIASLRLDGVEYGRAEGRWRFVEPVLERPKGGQRSELFGPLNWRALDVNQQWKPDWEAVWEGPSCMRESSHILLDGCAEYRQALELPSGDTVTLIYHVFPDEPSLELAAELHLTGSRAPQAIYLPFPVALDPQEARCHFETAGAVVELDREQLPYSSRHYLTTQRFIRLQDGARGLTVACPDAPLWQVGGLTFGRHREGAVAREEAMLAAWLTNNYWDVNFCANQAGVVRFRFRLIPHPAQELAESIRQALPYAVEPQLHAHRKQGPVRNPRAQLLALELGGAILTGLDTHGNGITLTLLNPEDVEQSVRIGPGAATFSSATQVTLAGEPVRNLPLTDGQARLVLSPREWTGIQVDG